MNIVIILVIQKKNITVNGSITKTSHININGVNIVMYDMFLNLPDSLHIKATQVIILM
jgi:hypothetical protein